MKPSGIKILVRIRLGLSGRAVLLLGTLALVAAPASAQESQPGQEKQADVSLPTGAREVETPEGFGAAKLGISKEQFRAAFPNATLLRDTANEEQLASSTIPALAFFEVKDQSVMDYKGCLVQFRFADDQLYYMNFNCGTQENAREVFIKKYGDPSMLVSDAAYWVGKERGVSLNLKSGQFGYYDRKMDKAVQAALANGLAQQEREKRAAEQRGQAGANDGAED